MSLEKSNRRQHDRTMLINDNEYSSLINLIEKSNGVALIMATVQLWLSEKPSHKDWHKAHTGIICFVKDYSKKSYYFRMFNLPARLLWEQEMYTPFSYVKITDNFHYFPADDCNAGLNFARVEEAEKFLNTIFSKIQSKSTKKKNSLKNQENIMNVPINRMVLSAQPIVLNPNQQMVQQSVREQEPSKYSTLKGKKNKKIDKSQISNPTGFRVVQHVGLSSANNNFEISLSSEDNLSKKMKEILESINCPVNKKTTQFLDNYIKSHGGIELFDEELKKQSKPMPSREPPSHPVQPPKVVNQAPSRPPPSLPNRAPNPVYAHPAPPPPPPLPQSLPPSIQNSAPPQPPPLPPMKNTSSMAPPPPPPLPSMPPECQTNQSRVAAPAPPPPPPPPPSLSDSTPSPLVIEKKSTNSLQQNQLVDSRDQLLESIRGFQGFQNKNASRNRISDPAPNDNNPPSVLDQLKNELIKRAQFLNDSSDEGSDDESDSEWNS